MPDWQVDVDVDKHQHARLDLGLQLLLPGWLRRGCASSSLLWQCGFVLHLPERSVSGDSWGKLGFLQQLPVRVVFRHALLSCFVSLQCRELPRY